MNKSAGRPRDDIEPLLRAVSHSFRRRILRLATAEDALLSPSKAAEQLEAPLPTVAYHFRVLDDANLLLLATTRPGKGSLEHLYRLNAKAASHPIVQGALSASE